MLVTTRGPGINLYQIKIGDSARAHRLLPTRIGLGNRYGGHKISKTNRRLTGLDTLHLYRFGLEINHTLKTAVALPFSGVVVTDKPQLTQHRVP